MPWFFTIPEFLKKRACRYLLQHYLGQFLEERICLDDLTVDLYNGTGSILNVPLNVEAINEVLLETGAPVKVVSGYLGRVTVTVPWTSLLKDNSKVEISGLALCVAPNVCPVEVGSDLGSMTDSLFFNMTSSMQLAEEVLKSGPSPGEGESGNSPGFEGMEALARAIELVLARVQISLVDATIQVNYTSPDHVQEYFLKVRISSIEFYDELSKLESSVDTDSIGTDTDTPSTQPTSDFAVKVLQCSGLKVEVGSIPLSNVKLEQSLNDSVMTDLDPLETSLNSHSSHGVPVAVASGQLSVNVKIKQNDREPGPKLEVNAFLGAVHLLVSPQQMSILVEMATGISSQGSGTSFEKLSSGQSRPIPKADMKTIESQLAKHQLREQKAKSKLQQHEDLFHADPWDNYLASHNPPHTLTDSTHSSVDEFYSLDLNASCAGSIASGVGLSHSPTHSEESFVSTTSKLCSLDNHFTKQPGSTHIHGRCVSDQVDEIPLHAGAGLQQLSQSPLNSNQHLWPDFQKVQSPFMKRSQATSNIGHRPSGSSVDSAKNCSGCRLGQDVCKYSVTVGGVTVALLESEPMHTYTTSVSTSGLPTSSKGKWSPKEGRSMDSRETDTSRYSSMDEGGLDPLKYFETISSLLRDGVNRKELESKQEELAHVLPNDHLLLWLSTFKVSVNHVGSKADLDLTIATAELWEYLYRNQFQLNRITKPISVSPIVQLFEDSSASPPVPCFKLKARFGSRTEKSKKKSRENLSAQQTMLDVSLARVDLNADVTLLDRLQPLLSASTQPKPTSLHTTSLEKMKQSLYMTSSNMYSINVQRQAVFNHAISAESAPRPDQRLSVKAKCATFNITLRFPIPDLKDVKRPPWYLRSLRNEVLFINVSNVLVSSILNPSALAGEGAYHVDVKFSSTKAYLSCDGSAQNRELFITVTSPLNQTPSAGFAECGHVRIIIQPPSQSVLEMDGSKERVDVQFEFGSYQYDSLDGEFVAEGGEPQPFSRKKSMFSTGRPADKESDEYTEVHSEELVLPGSPQEMAEFEQHASSTAQYSITCTLPVVRVHLPSNKFLGILYNRFATDLALWQPASATEVDRANAKSMMYSCMDVLQPAATKEDRFEMCKSVLKEEFSDDDDNLLDTRLGVVYSQNQYGVDHTHTTPQYNRQGLSLLSFSLTIENGRVSMVSEVEQSTLTSRTEVDGEVDSSLFHSAENVTPLLDLSPKQTSPPCGTPDHGLFLLALSNLQLFSVVGYRGDSTHDYFCAQIGEFSLHHSGNLHSEVYSCVSDGAGDHPILDSLLPLVHRSSSSSANKPHSFPGSHDPPEPMVAVAMEMNLDKERSSKTNKCAVALSNTTVQYHMSLPQHDCFKQLGDFFSLVDDTVPGYDPPSIITELHTHLNNCCVEYKPLYLPLHVLLLLESVSLSTSIVTGAPVLVVRLVTDGTYLLLAHEQQEHPDPRQGFVCVLEMEWFELTFRLCNNTELGDEYEKLFSRMPDISVECSSNVVHLRTCVDTCIALRDLLVYVATYGDLRDILEQRDEKGIIRDYSSLATNHGFSSLASQSSISNSASPLTSLPDTVNIGDLINEAMEDLPNPDSQQDTGAQISHENVCGTVSHKRTSGSVNSSPSKSKMEIHMESDKSVVLNFFSDSSDNDSDNERLSRQSKNEGKGQSARARRRERKGHSGKHLLSPPNQSEKLSSSDRGSIFSESDDDFCFVDTPTSTKVAPGSKPQVKCLLGEEETVEFIENHFSLPDCRTDQLQRPKHFPEPITQFTLKEMSIIWYLYGGHDFAPVPSPNLSHSPSPTSSPLNPKRQSHSQGHSSSPRLGKPRSIPSSQQPIHYRTRSGSGNSVHHKKSLQGTSPASQRRFSNSSSPGAEFIKVPSSKRSRGILEWKTAGGLGRQHDVLVQVELDKVRFQHETYPITTEQASRFVLLIKDLEIRDRLSRSQINKLLYQYSTEAIPKQLHANMVSVKVLFTRPEVDSDLTIEEAAVRLSILPIRLNLDQDTILFLYDFFKQVGNVTAIRVTPPSDLTSSNSPFGATYDDSKKSSSRDESDTPFPAQNHTHREVFIRSFVFQPDLPIRIDYEAKGFKTERGTLAAILLGLGHLNTSEVRLKALTYKKGILGLDKLLEYASNEWVQDIKGYQLPLLLKGVGPMHQVTQLVYGVVDLVWLPYQHYQEDGRIIWGLQRGATAFTSSTGVAIVELSSRLLESVQSFAQLAYDMVTPNECPSRALVHQHKPHEPLDFREGFANAYDVVSAGIGGTARDMYSAAAKEHEERGVSGAVGGVLRQIPGTIVKPIILASEATRHVLGGVKNQFVPDARVEASEKWKSANSSEEH